MLCPYCSSKQNNVIDSRETEAGAAIRRRRVCGECERRFTTKERVEKDRRLTVIKRGKVKVPFRRENIFSGVERACYKLDVSEEQLQLLVDSVEASLFGEYDREVTTEQIGRCVGQHLRALSQVAYVRFMSVHRQFRTVEEFIEEVGVVRQQVERESPAQQSLFERPPPA